MASPPYAGIYPPRRGVLAAAPGGAGAWGVGPDPPRRSGPKRASAASIKFRPSPTERHRHGVAVSGRGPHGPGGGRGIRHWRQDLSGMLLPALGAARQNLMDAPPAERLAADASLRGRAGKDRLVRDGKRGVYDDGAGTVRHPAATMDPGGNDRPGGAMVRMSTSMYAKARPPAVSSGGGSCVTLATLFFQVVGVGGFEPPSSWSRTRRPNQAGPHPGTTAATTLRPRLEYSRPTGLRSMGAWAGARAPAKSSSGPKRRGPGRS